MMRAMAYCVLAMLLLPKAATANSCYRTAAIEHQVDEYVLAAIVESLYEKTEFKQSVVSAAIESGQRYGVEPGLVLAVIHAESAFNPDAVSHKGAQGLMQIMPATARFLELKNPFNPIENIDAGAKYLAYLQAKFPRTDLVLAAYNAGEGAVRRAKGIPPYKETQEYVKKVQRLSGHYRGVVEKIGSGAQGRKCRSAAGVAVALSAEQESRGNTWDAVGAIFSENEVAQRRFRMMVYQNWKASISGMYAQAK